MPVVKPMRVSPHRGDYYYVGVFLAITSCAFIGSSFIVKKISLARLTNSGKNVRAGAGGFGYLRDWVWWLGLALMGIGELVNFTAYLFAPASLVTPLGALSVLVSAILASKFLKEHLTGSGKVGCLLCIIGSTVIVIHAPVGDEVQSLEELWKLVQQPIVIYYLAIITVYSTLTVLCIGPKYGPQFVWVYISLCSAIGSLSVMACKSLGVAIKEFLNMEASGYTAWVAVGLVAGIIVSVCVQMTYLNRALDLFSASVVTPVYYVMFTTLVMVASALLLREWIDMALQDSLGMLCGFAIISVALYLLNSMKDTTKEWNVTQPLIKRTKRKIIGSI